MLGFSFFWFGLVSRAMFVSTPLVMKKMMAVFAYTNRRMLKGTDMT